ncbi:MAG: AI-2E family transporter [Candidatus Aenigmarchaeota archaeon]|nr:AI-2E family transporter [Candidatus Aenigmarchaeota archaeon]
MDEEIRLKRTLASVLIVSLIGILIYAMLPYMAGVFGALIMYVIFRPVYRRISGKHRLPQVIAGIIVIILSLAVVLLPSIFLVSTAYSQINQVLSNSGFVGEAITTIDTLAPDLEIEDNLRQEVKNIKSALGGIIFKTANSMANIVINITLMYFLLYYLLTSEDSFRRKFYSLSPFNKRHTNELIVEFEKVTNTTIVVSGIIAIFQGALIWLCFWYFGLPGALFWGFLGAIFSFLPLLGPHLIWLPVLIIKALQGDYLVAGVFFIVGIVMTISDSVIRPPLQQQMGNIHPVVSLIGVLAGIPVFGLMGVVIGPLLLSYILLMFRMYRQEYLKEPESEGDLNHLPHKEEHTEKG